MVGSLEGERANAGPVIGTQVGPIEKPAQSCYRSFVLLINLAPTPVSRARQASTRLRVFEPAAFGRPTGVQKTPDCPNRSLMFFAQVNRGESQGLVRRVCPTPDHSSLRGWIQAVDATVSASISAGVR
jgi:hypothetical protein